MQVIFLIQAIHVQNRHTKDKLDKIIPLVYLKS